MYRDGEDSVAAHSDVLTNLGPRPTIVSLSLGATRLFRLQRIDSDEVHDIWLPHNSVLIMWPPTQVSFRVLFDNSIY